MHEILMGFSLKYWGDDSVIEGIEQISTAKFPGFESGTNVVARYEERVEVFQEILERTDVELVSIINHSNFLIDEKMEEEVEVDMNVVRFLHNVGAQFLIVTCGPSRPEGNTEEDWQNMIRCIDELGHRSLDSSIQLCVMPHHGTILSTVDDIHRLMDSTEKDVVFLCPDTGELRAMNADAAKIVDQYLDRIPYIRFRDVLDKKSINRPRLINKIKKEKLTMAKPIGVPLGTGLSDLKGVWDVLNNREFEGWAIAAIEEPRNSSSKILKDACRYLEDNFEVIF